MKKPKVILDTLSPRYEDGHREHRCRKIIATCNNRNDAELIRHLLADHYKVLTERDEPNMCQYVLTVDY